MLDDVWKFGKVEFYNFTSGGSEMSGFWWWSVARDTSGAQTLSSPLIGLQLPHTGF